MRNSPPQAVRLCDYMPPDFLIDSVALDISLHKTQTRVRAKLALRRNPKGRPDAPLTLDGDGLTPRRVALDGRELAPRDYEATPESLTLRAVPPAPFALEIETLVDPAANTQALGALSLRLGLLHAMRGGRLSPHHLFPRPPRRARVYTTRIEADRSEAPVLLANGNPIEAGELGGRPAFRGLARPASPSPAISSPWSAAISAVSRDAFVTASGREVELAIYVEHGKERARRLRDGRAEARDALGRGDLWPRI